MNTILPMVVRPRKRCGVTDNRRDMPPVDMVKVNHAHVKWCSLSRKEIFGGVTDLSSSIVV